MNNKWKSVKKELPEYMETVLCVCVNKFLQTEYLHTGYLHTDDEWQANYDGRSIDVIYWMPLPELPNQINE